MNTRHKKTLSALLANPISKTIPFRDAEALLLAVGCHIREGNGSRVSFVRDGMIWPTHRPHPQKEMRSYQVKELRDYLAALGVKL